MRRNQPKAAHDVHLFTLRLWAQHTHEGLTEWRGEVISIASGVRHSFQGWPALIEAVTAGLKYLDEDHQPDQVEKRGKES